MSLNNIETCTVQRSPADAEGGYSWSITFTSNLGNVEMISPVSSLVGVGVKVDVKETQQGNWLGGSFTLSYGGATTIDLAFDATSSVVEAALESLSTIGDVIVTRTPQIHSVVIYGQ